ncbi:MAG TPA: tetratricopeptide repeat protein, partial [Rhodospirillales bacterium]|nr:tetratricopeptide repeat protein [Rhodospirillales bacterium]
AHTGHRSLSRAVAACLAAVTPVIAFGFYIVLGSPNQPNLPHAQRDISAEIEARQGRLEKAEVLQLAAKLVETLKKKPDDIKGWLLLGRTYLTISEFDDALEAFRRATELSDRRPDIVASYAEAMVVAEDGRITARAKKLFTDILATDPFDPKARYYLGLEQAQTGNISGALQTWTDLIQLSPADAPWLETINQKIAVAAKELGIDPDTVKPSARAVALALTRGLGAPKSSSLPMTSMPPATSPGASSPAPGATPRGPSAADVEAAGQMSATDRDKMVRSMVNRLAERLKENPDDLAGWQRLAKAYAVLGEKEKAEAVKKKIEALTK